MLIAVGISVGVSVGKAGNDFAQSCYSPGMVRPLITEVIELLQ